MAPAPTAPATAISAMTARDAPGKAAPGDRSPVVEQLQAGDAARGRRTGPPGDQQSRRGMTRRKKRSGQPGMTARARMLDVVRSLPRPASRRYSNDVIALTQLLDIRPPAPRRTPCREKRRSRRPRTRAGGRPGEPEAPRRASAGRVRGSRHRRDDDYRDDPPGTDGSIDVPSRSATATDAGAPPPPRTDPRRRAWWPTPAVRSPRRRWSPAAGRPRQRSGLRPPKVRWK